MRAGKLRDTITIQRVTTSLNDAGSPQETWNDVATLRAEQVDCSTEDRVQRFGNSTERAIVFRSRWFGDISVVDRVLFEGITFTIKKLVADPRRRSLEISVLQVGP